MIIVLFPPQLQRWMISAAVEEKKKKQVNI